MNEDARRRLIQKAIDILEEGSALPAVTLDDFFDSNTDERSIGVNLPPDRHIGLAGFRRVLGGIRDKPNVQAVFLELTEIPDPEDELDTGIWPVACVAFLVTSASLPEVREWVAPLHPRDASEGWGVKPGISVPIPTARLKPGMRPVRVWLL